MPLVATIAAAFVVALAFGFIAARFRLPPLVVYLLAGIALRLDRWLTQISQRSSQRWASSC